MQSTNTQSNLLQRQLSQLFPASGAKEITYIAQVLLTQPNAQNTSNLMPRSFTSQTTGLGLSFTAYPMQYTQVGGEVPSSFDFTGFPMEATTTNYQMTPNFGNLLPSTSMTRIEAKTEKFEDDNAFDFVNSFEHPNMSLNQIYEDGQNLKNENLLAGSKKIKREDVQLNQIGSKKAKSKHTRSRKGLWTEEEDAQIRDLVAEHGPMWARIGSIIGGKTGKQVRDRYINMSRPDISYAKWTEEEDKLFVSLLEKYGNKWSQIAAEMPGRTESQVKSKFYCLKRNRKSDDQRKLSLKKAIEGVEKKKTKNQLQLSVSSPPSTSTLEYTPKRFHDIDIYFGFNQGSNDFFQQDEKVESGYDVDSLLSEKNTKLEDSSLHWQDANVYHSSSPSGETSPYDEIDSFFEFKTEERTPYGQFAAGINYL